jgi:hypothetical protein
MMKMYPKSSRPKWSFVKLIPDRVSGLRGDAAAHLVAGGGREGGRPGDNKRAEVDPDLGPML